MKNNNLSLLVHVGMKVAIIEEKNKYFYLLFLCNDHCNYKQQRKHFYFVKIYICL